MTISYSDRFSQLLFRWKGSLWKTIYKDLAIFLLMYYAINFVFRSSYFLDHEQKQTFARISALFNEYTKQIPLTFLLGFYVGMVVKRWWEQFQYIAYPDALMMAVSSYVRGVDPEVRTIRRTAARYALLTCVLAWRTLSQRVLKRFPTEEHIVAAGLMTQGELDLYRTVEVRFDPHGQWVVPVVWMQTLFIRCFEEKRITRTNELRALLLELEKFRTWFLQLFIYDWVSIPLVYTQVATIATYGYFALCLVARQYPTRSSNPTPGSPSTQTVDVYIPIFTILQFLFFVGWLKVGEDLINPFGEDDEDFELNYLLDRHAETAYLLVDTLHGQMPLVLQNDTVDTPLRHTRASAAVPDHRPVCHVDEDELTDDDNELATESLLDLRELTLVAQERSAKEKFVSFVQDTGKTVIELTPTAVITDRTPLGPAPISSSRRP